MAIEERAVNLRLEDLVPSEVLEQALAEEAFGSPLVLDVEWEIVAIMFDGRLRFRVTADTGMLFGNGDREVCGGE